MLSSDRLVLDWSRLNLSMFLENLATDRSTTFGSGLEFSGVVGGSGCVPEFGVEVFDGTISSSGPRSSILAIGCCSDCCNLSEMSGFVGKS